MPCRWKWKNEKTETGVAILIYDKIDFKTKTVLKDKGGYCIMTKESINQSRICNTCKDTCAQHRNTEVYKANINKSTGRNWKQYNNKMKL